MNFDLSTVCSSAALECSIFSLFSVYSVVCPKHTPIHYSERFTHSQQNSLRCPRPLFLPFPPPLPLHVCRSPLPKTCELEFDNALGSANAGHSSFSSLIVSTQLATLCCKPSLPKYVQMCILDMTSPLSFSPIVCIVHKEMKICSANVCRK